MCLACPGVSGVPTFLVKIKGHRGEPLNEMAHLAALKARHIPSRCITSSRLNVVAPPALGSEACEGGGETDPEAVGEDSAGARSEGRSTPWLSFARVLPPAGFSDVWRWGPALWVALADMCYLYRLKRYRL